MKNLKIGIIGLGSIGQRHVSELLNLGITQFYALRTNKGAKKVDESFSPYVKNLSDINEFLSLELDGYIIANPTAFHANSLKLIIDKQKSIFIEKPIFSDINDFNLFLNIDTSKIQVGFCLRFSNFFKRIKEILDQNILGDIYHSRFNVGQYLPTWHPYTDYRNEYYSREELGGGALTTLSHELDLALYFFGKPSRSFKKSYKMSDLEIDVDDYSLILNEFGDHHINRIEFDFLSKNKERKGVVFGQKADLHYDFFQQTLKVFNETGERIIDKKIDLNNMYAEQMSAFLELITKGKQKGSSWEENFTITKIIENKYG